MRRSKRGDKMEFINLESLSDRLSCGEMSVMDGIERTTQDRNPHVPGLILTRAKRKRDSAQPKIMSSVDSYPFRFRGKPRGFGRMFLSVNQRGS